MVSVSSSSPRRGLGNPHPHHTSLQRHRRGGSERLGDSRRHQRLRAGARALTLLSGPVGHLRFAFRSNTSGYSVGAYIDDVRVDSEAVDADGDGIGGVLSEWLTHGTDPLWTTQTVMGWMTAQRSQTGQIPDSGSF